MNEQKKLLFSVTAKDCDWSYTRGTGAGGQKRNKTSSAVHCTHRASRAHGYSEATRSQADNKRDAFTKMTETKEFKTWHRMEVMRQTGKLDEMEREVQRQLKKVKLEVKIDGKWTEVSENDLVEETE
jgi:protein subunit release factor B